MCYMPISSHHSKLASLLVTTEIFQLGIGSTDLILSLVSSVIHLLFLKASLYEVFACLFLPGIGFFTLFVSLIKLVNLWAIFPQPSLWGLSGVIMIDLLPPWMTMKLMYLPLSLYFRELWKVVLHVPSLYCLPLFFCSCIEDEHQPLPDINAYSNLSH